MKYLLIAIVFLSLSCKKEEKIEPTPLVMAPKKAATIVQFYCGYFARGCEDYAEDSVYINIVDDNKIHVARRYSESETPFSWGFSGEFDKTKTEFTLNSDSSFSKAVDKVALGVSAHEGKYDEPIKIIFKCSGEPKKCSISGYPAEMPGSAFESSMLSFDLKCNQVALKDNSTTDCN
jgi:hypothetical protein